MLQLSESNSLPFVADLGDRHFHISLQIVGGQKYADNIEGPLDTLNTKLDLRKEAERAVTRARDSVWLHSSILDDIIRKVKRAAQDYDTDHLGSHVLNLIFPDGNITEIVEATIEDKPVKAHEVALKIVSLGETHTMYPLAAEINTGVDNYNAKTKAVDDAEVLYKEACVAAEIAKSAVIKCYNGNYFAAGNDVDKKFAERLFPKVKPKSDPDEDKP